MEQSLRLLVVDPDLASAIEDQARRSAALGAVTAGKLELGQGDVLPPAEVTAQAPFGIVVLRGFLIRELTTEAGRVSGDLFGPEDVVQLDGPTPEVAMLEHNVGWTAITDVRLALLDGAFFARAAKWPEVSAKLLERAGRFGQRLALRGAIATLQTVDARLLASMWTWASQWATVAGQGVVLRVPLSHERLARLVHARRPTVTTAIGRLRREGLIEQRRDGAWLLHGPRIADWGTSSGVAMPPLGEMGERATGNRRTAAGAITNIDSRMVATRELKVRLAEQRETLRIAAKRHDEMLARMREEAEKLTAASGESRR